MTAVPAPTVSVVVCTHNRADLLATALRSIVDQAVPGSRFEVVVVDNGSIDRTAEVVRSFDGTAELHYVFEPALGLCHARNTGWQQARGRYVAYLDDDAVACAGWLTAMIDAFERTPDAGAVGGRVTPIWEVERPPWLADEVIPSLAVVDWSPTAKDIADLTVEWLVGANLAIPRAVLAEVGGFHPALDRMGTTMLSGDVFLQKQILQRGHPCVYEPAMAVRHLVPATRLDKGWFRRRYFWQGISDVIVWLIERGPSRLERARAAAERTGQLLRSREALASVVRPSDDPYEFTRRCFTWTAVGQIAGLLSRRRPPA